MATTKATAEQCEEAKKYLLDQLTAYIGHRGQQMMGELIFLDRGGRSSYAYQVYVAVADDRGRPGLKQVTREVGILHDGRVRQLGDKIRVSGSGFNHMRHVADSVAYSLFGDTQALNAEEI